MQTITFYSYKGGTGRTLVVANMALHLARFGQRVVALDLDLEAPGLHYKFNLGPGRKPGSIDRGVLDYLYASLVEAHPPGPLGDFIVSVPLPKTATGKVDLMPAGAVPSPDYWHKLSRINWHDILYAPGAMGIRAFLELKERIREELQPDFLLIDSRTGITEIGGIATAVMPDRVVCLVLANRENLEGARAVLRSLRRSPRIGDREPPEIVVVLSRIPSRDEPEADAKLLADIRTFLNEEAEQLEDTLNVPEIVVLHSEPELQVLESLRVGERSPEDSVLLRDYLRLFAKIIPGDVLLPYIGPLADQAKLRAYEDPDAAQRDLESLAQLGHPDAYRELLRFYRLRNAPASSVLRTAQRLWEITKASEDPLIVDTVKSCFAQAVPPGPSPYRGRIGRIEGNLSLLHFVEAVWRAHGATDPKVAMDLAESFDNFGQSGHGADVLKCLIVAIGPEETAVVRCLQLLRQANRLPDCKALIDQYREPLSGSKPFVSTWARIALENADSSDMEELVSPNLLALILDADPLLALRLFDSTGRQEMAKELAPKALHAILSSERLRRDPEEISRLGAMFARLGLSEEFERALRLRFSEGEAEGLLHYARRR